MKAALLALSLVLYVAPLGATLTFEDQPTLKLKAPRRSFLRPTMPNQRRRTTINIRVSAEMKDLKKIENPEEYYCLEEVWDWDDDTESEYEPDCDPYEEGAELKTHFSASHRYRFPGFYWVELRLMRNGKTILYGKTKVNIQ